MNNPPIPKKPKVVPIGKLRRECDAIMQETGRLMNPECLLCKNPCQVMHHFIPKSVCARLRYEWLNLVNLCNGCHNRLHQSGDPEYEQRIIRIHGMKWYNHLQKIRKEQVRPNKSYYLAVKSDLEKLRNEIKTADRM